MEEKVEEGLADRGKRCRKCNAHGKVNFLRNHHKKKCEFKCCDCKTCVMVSRTREKSRTLLKTKRQAIKEQKLKEQRRIGNLPLNFWPHLHRGMPVAMSCRSPQLLLLPNNQQPQSHIIQFQSHVTNMTKLVAKILQQLLGPEHIPHNLYNVVSNTFSPMIPVLPTLQGPFNGSYLTTFCGDINVADNMAQVRMLPQAIPVNTFNEMRFGSNLVVGVPQRYEYPGYSPRMHSCHIP